MAELIHLVRHGEVHNPRHLAYASLPGFHLSDRGIRQAREAGRYLAHRPIQAVWSSPLERALQTAGHLATAHGLTVKTLSDLVEWRLLDRWAGHVWDELPRLFPGEVQAYLQHPTDLRFSPETLKELADRVAGAVRETNDRFPGGEVVLVGHQDPLQAGRLALTGQPLEGLFCDRPGHGTVITLRPGDPWTEIRRWDP